MAGSFIPCECGTSLDRWDDHDRSCPIYRFRERLLTPPKPEPDHRPLREIFPPRERKLVWAAVDVPRWSWFRKDTHRLMVHVAPKAGRS